MHTIEVSDTHITAPHALPCTVAAGDEDWLPKFLPNSVTLTAPVAGTFARELRFTVATMGASKVNATDSDPVRSLDETTTAPARPRPLGALHDALESEIQRVDSHTVSATAAEREYDTTPKPEPKATTIVDPVAGPLVAAIDDTAEASKVKASVNEDVDSAAETSAVTR